MSILGWAFLFNLLIVAYPQKFEIKTKRDEQDSAFIGIKMTIHV